MLRTLQTSTSVAETSGPAAVWPSGACELRLYRRRQIPKLETRRILASRNHGGSFSPWFLVGHGGRDPYDSPLRSPKSSPRNPSFPHSLRRTREPFAGSAELKVPVQVPILKEATGGEFRVYRASIRLL